MADLESGGAHKVGVVALLLAALGGVARFGDDCGRAAKVAAPLGDDALRGGKVAGVGDDLSRTGLGLGDDLARNGRLPEVAGEAGSLKLGEGSRSKVVDDAAPGAGHSIEEALVELGLEVGLEVATADLPGADVEPVD